LSDDPAKVAVADKYISEDTLLHAIMRNTIAPVLMNAGFRGNVIPGSAEATINFRTIPGTTAEELIEELNGVIKDPRVEITVASMRSMSPNSTMTPEQTKQMEEMMRAARNTKPSPQDNELYKALAKSLSEVYPTTKVTPYLFQAGTDSGAWRMRGIPVYGIYPYPIDHEDLKRMHGNDERVPISSLESGVDLIYKTLLAVAAK
jgi:acetylornithine deacetylase/succinyl-diaminopimelate desuccinylase-like protein